MQKKNLKTSIFYRGDKISHNNMSSLIDELKSHVYCFSGLSKGQASTPSAAGMEQLIPVFRPYLLAATDVLHSSCTYIWIKIFCIS